MPSPAIPSPDDISLEAFRALLARYPAVLQAVSDAKGSKPGQTPLADLDAFRYETAPGRYAKPAPDAGGGSSADAMTLDDVKTLVSWKLRHGKFRPTLMRLVASNPPETVQATVQDALRVYGREAPATDTAAAALRVLCRLRGVGPATASLLLAVHDPARVVFFGDEVYAWLCGGPAWQRPQKYNDREYAALCAAAAALQARLGDGVQAADVEKVAYVLLAGDGAAAAAAAAGAPAKTKAAAKGAKKKAAAEDTTPEAATAAAARKPKRKRPASDEHGPDAPVSETGAPLRRTERVRRLL